MDLDELREWLTGWVDHGEVDWLDRDETAKLRALLTALEDAEAWRTSVRGNMAIVDPKLLEEWEEDRQRYRAALERLRKTLAPDPDDDDYDRAYQVKRAYGIVREALEGK